MSAALVVAAGIGMWSTDVEGWYRRLEKPSWQPPDWLFGAAWTTIYCFMVASAGMAWNAADAQQQSVLLWLIGINLILNILWSVLFFKIHRPDWALVEVVGLWLSILFWIIYTYSIHTLSAWLLAPYLLWVSVAAFLNLTIIRLNPKAHLV